MKITLQVFFHFLLSNRRQKKVKRKKNALCSVYRYLFAFFWTGKRKRTERKPARLCYSKLAMQMLRLGSGELALTLIFFWLTAPKKIYYIFFIYNKVRAQTITALTPRLRRHCYALFRIVGELNLNPIILFLFILFIYFHSQSLSWVSFIIAKAIFL